MLFSLIIHRFATFLKESRIPSLLLAGLVVVCLIGEYFLWQYSLTVHRAFGQQNWSIPSQVYARPVELYPSKSISLKSVESKLRKRQYVRTDTLLQSGQYHRGSDYLTVSLRSFPFLDGREPSRTIRLEFARGRVVSLKRLEASSPPQQLSLARLAPLKIGSFFSHRYEDWVPLMYDEIPPLLKKSLILMEDQRFYDHFGLDLFGIFRAMKANILAGEIVQGGSTITQQLVKNRFLGNQRTVWRKVREAVLALLTEWHFDKKTILQAYVNEVYMGQLGRKSIQGFGKASQYYFGTSVERLSPDKIAMLVGLIRGPSQYNPRRNRDMALKRRNFILERMREAELISTIEYQRALKRRFEVAPKESVSLTPYPDFLELVKKRLRRDFPSRKLHKNGLKVYTTLVPKTQRKLERSVEEILPRLNQRTADPESPLQTASVVARIKTGEITGLIGGRRPGYPGFNRALSPRRSVGSVIKPAVYLTALKMTDSYNLLTRLSDQPLSYTPKGDTRPWRPRNYSRTFHDTVPLLEALTQSYNVATTRLGLRLGISPVLRTLRQLGLKDRFGSHPSLFLGSSSLSPLEVTQMYQTLAGQGFHSPLKAVRGVMSREGETLKRNPLHLRRTLDPGPVYTVNYALRRVTREGTALRLRKRFPASLKLAGKTGTTQRYRDSWFAGFSRNRVMTVWIGHDDDSPTGLTGATGALRLWADVAKRLNVQSLATTPPRSVEMLPVDRNSWWPTEGRCEKEIMVPFIEGKRPDQLAPCARDDENLFF